VDQVKKICTRILTMDHGRIIKDGLI